MPRRKPGTLLPLETEILEVALSLRRSEQAAFHGFGLAQTMRERAGSRSLTSHGTLYKALGRLEEFGLLTSRWEDAAAAEGRPRRRLYELTGQGARAVERAHADDAQPAPRRSPRVATEPG
jgi:PadR family transcriptional regulator PadR